MEKDKIEVLNELAERLSTEQVPASQQLEFLKGRLNQIEKMIAETGASEEEARSEALEVLVDSVNAPGNSREPREYLAKLVKPMLAKQFSNGEGHVTADEIFQGMKLEHDYQAIDSKGIGDLLGRHGFYLISDKKRKIKIEKKTKYQKAYRIPNPESFSEWYESSKLSVPRAYYTKEELLYLLKIEATNANSKFIGK